MLVVPQELFVKYKIIFTLDRQFDKKAYKKKNTKKCKNRLSVQCHIFQ